jgi:membrane protein required for colicin V production
MKTSRAKTPPRYRRFDRSQTGFVDHDRAARDTLGVPMNPFDIAVSIALLVAAIAGFNAGLLRSAVTILAYLIGMPLAIWLMSLLSAHVDVATSPSVAQPTLMFFAVFLVTGMVLGKFARMAVDDAIGPETGLGDRLLGALLGAVRVGLVAITLVAVFDLLIPVDRQPGYLMGSQLRPLLSMAGARGIRSLPPEAASYIDRLKRARQI